MKLGGCFLRHEDDGSRTICIRVEADTFKEAAELREMAECARKPVTTYGNIDSGCLWAWFQIPASKELPFDVRYFGNERRKARR
jgi:hypothetical protein